MATKYNSEGRVPSNYPGLFNARENRLITHNYCVVELTNENFEVLPDDAVTHILVLGDGNSTITLPKPELSKGRLISISVFSSTGVKLLQEKDGTEIIDNLPAANYQFFCTGSEYKLISASAGV